MIDEKPYQFVIQFAEDALSGVDEIMDLEEQIEGIIDASKDLIDGHDIGMGKINIFLDTDDPKSLFLRLEQADLPNRFGSCRIAYRLFEDDDSTNLYPEDDTSEFEP